MISTVLLFYCFVNVVSVLGLSISTHDVKLQLGSRYTVNISVDHASEQTLQLGVQHDDLVHITPKIIRITTNDTKVQFVVQAVGAGHSLVSVINSTNEHERLDNLFVRVTVYKNYHYDQLSLVIGWTYFAAWSVSFYGQIVTNYKRQSVVGLNFDFLALNLVGFALYSIFNIGLYTVDIVKNEYANRHPRGLNPVQLNDIVFSVHATVATLVTIGQCFLYERDAQRVSNVARFILGFFGLFLLISLLLVWDSAIHWLDFLYYCSYVKLTITLIKYLPQAYMNYKRKSTIGWSIENIFLDCTGGILSMLQMIVNAYNYDDWISIFGDPTKFGLGLFSMIFDIFFMVQHYALYRHTNYEES